MKYTVTALLLFACMAVSSCNTVEGIGEDLQNAGRAIEKAGQN